jgi:predicted ATPase
VQSIRPNNLPLWPKTLVGRAAEVSAIVELLNAARLVTITGSGGIGKTMTALEAGNVSLEASEGGAWFVELAPLRDPSLVAATIARTLGIQEQTNQPPLDALLAHLNPTRTLLILDNCEHVIGEAAIVVDALLRGCAGVRILATSREPLRIAGEFTYRLPSLGVPSPDSARRLAAADAVKYGAVLLFAERARAVDQCFVLHDENAPIVADICRCLDGIPLAIELAAARVTILSVRALLQKLDHRFGILTAGQRTALPRHLTMSASLDWSHDLLGERERALFRRLGVFVNGFTLEGAVAVGSGEGLDHDDAFGVLASLVDQSLVQAESDGDALRYRMLESTRAYAREKLEAAGEVSTTVKHHLRYLRDLLAAAMTRVECGGGWTEFECLLTSELEDVRVALDAAAGGVEFVEWKAGAELLVAIDYGWAWIGLVTEGIARLERFISLLRTDERGLTSRLWSAIARIAANAIPVRAREAAFTAVALARDAKDPAALADALPTYVDTLVWACRFDVAAAALAEAEALAPVGNCWLGLRILEERALLSFFVGDLDAAAQVREQLRKTHLQLGNRAHANVAAINLAEIEHRRGQTPRAVMIVQEVLPALRTGRSRLMRASALANLCGYLAAIDRLSEARAVAREVFDESSQYERDGLYVTIAAEHAALIAALGGDVRRGARLAGYAEAGFARIGFQRDYTEQITRARLEGLLRERLPPAELESLVAAGAALSPEEAVALALANCIESCPGPS